jgi:hypothetical protein
MSLPFLAFALWTSLGCAPTGNCCTVGSELIKRMCSILDCFYNTLICQILFVLSAYLDLTCWHIGMFYLCITYINIRNHNRYKTESITHRF